MRKHRVGDMVVACRDFDLYVSIESFLHDGTSVERGDLLVVLEDVGRAVFAAPAGDHVDYRVLTSRGEVGIAYGAWIRKKK